MIKPLYNLTTNAQVDTFKAFDFALRTKSVVIVTDKHGSGFHFSLKRFNAIFPDLRVAEIKLSHSLEHDTAISMFRELGCQIKLQHKNYKRIKLAEFLTSLANRAKLDLRGRPILIVFDRFEKLKTEIALTKFFGYLQSLQLPCGIIIRTNVSHIRQIRAQFEQVFAYISQFNRKNIREITEDEVLAFCDAYGLKDKLLREQISKQTRNLHIVFNYVINASRLPEATQMTLF